MGMDVISFDNLEVNDEETIEFDPSSLGGANFMTPQHQNSMASQIIPDESFDNMINEMISDMKPLNNSQQTQAQQIQNVDNQIENLGSNEMSELPDLDQLNIGDQISVSPPNLNYNQPPQEHKVQNHTQPKRIVLNSDQPKIDVPEQPTQLTKEEIEHEIKTSSMVGTLNSLDIKQQMPEKPKQEQEQEQEQEQKPKPKPKQTEHPKNKEKINNIEESLTQTQSEDEIILEETDIPSQNVNDEDSTKKEKELKDVPEKSQFLVGVLDKYTQLEKRLENKEKRISSKKKNLTRHYDIIESLTQIEENNLLQNIKLKRQDKSIKNLRVIKGHLATLKELDETLTNFEDQETKIIDQMLKLQNQKVGNYNTITSKSDDSGSKAQQIAEQINEDLNSGNMSDALKQAMKELNFNHITQK